MTATAARDGGSSVAVRTFQVASIIGLWLLMRPYAGIVHDARIYVGRAMADLHPATIGAELAFVRDGQSGFSLFPRALTAAVGSIGPGPAALCVTVLGLAVWLGAAAFMLSRLYRGASLWASLVCLAALPAAYGSHEVFSWAEPFATPRIFAEAASLAALGLLIDGRRFWALLALAAGVAVHPLMTLPTLAAGLAYLGVSDRRWRVFALACVGLGLAAAAVAALAGLPLLSRLTQVIDAQWLAILEARTPYLFPNLWTGGSWALLACQATTLALAYGGASDRQRALIVATSLTCAAAILATAIVPTLLVIQLQLWRAQWLTSFLGAAMFAAAVAPLWRRDGAGRAAVLMLACAWIGRETLAFAAVCCGLALVLGLFPRARDLPRAVPIAITVFGGAAIAGLVGAEMLGFSRVVRSSPPDTWNLLHRLASTTPSRAMMTAMAVAAVAGFVPRAVAARTAALAGSMGLTLVAVLYWDARPPFDRMVESGAASSLTARLPPGGGEWVDGSGKTWLLTGRPEWWSSRQGAGVVFDRTLAVEWNRRYEALHAAGLETSLARLFDHPEDAGPPTMISGAGLSAVCNLAGGPEWVVAPVSRLDPSAMGPGVAVWRSPAPFHLFNETAKRLAEVRDFAIISCPPDGGGSQKEAP
ncbi:MAG TPA: hypothetical protein VFW47_15565 [Phenylobacterium sp.]|nr:hypothetical protein [Phenylobacterium sp.]